MRMTGLKSLPYTIIIGCGRLGSGIAGVLSDRGQDVLVVDCDPQAFRKLSPSFGGLTRSGDATDLNVLGDVDMDRACAVIIVTDNDNVNMMVAQLVYTLAPRAVIIARLSNPDCACVYQELGIHTICPALLSAREIGMYLHIGPTDAPHQTSSTGKAVI